MKGVESRSDAGTGDSRRSLWLVAMVAVLWSLLQVWYVSPLPFALNIGVFNAGEARFIHLSFALTLVYLLAGGWRRYLLSVAVLPVLYLLVFQTELAERSGAPLQIDLFIAAVGLLMLLDATRRVVGPALTVVATVFLAYTMLGPWMPDVLAHKGATLTKLLSHQWLTSEGVFGVALGVATEFVFLFVLFGALLEVAGAGQYFIRSAFSLLGHLRGGPAKAAVVASGLSGMVSGSSIANVVTTGTFTIPLMKRVGFPGTKAAAVEVAASTNGQLTPPVMGAAAFLMVEYVGISYLEVIRHAALPAIASYIALFYIVHLEARKSGLEGLPRHHNRSLANRLLAAAAGFAGMVILAAAVYYGMGWIKVFAGEWSPLVVVFLLLIAYIALLKVAAGGDLEMTPEERDLKQLPDVWPTLASGLYFLLPVVMLMWNLIVERYSPGLSVFWALVLLAGIVVTHKPLIAFFEKRYSGRLWKSGVEDLFRGFRDGAINMIPIAIATATAGIVVGTVTLTGLGLMMTEIVEAISGGQLLLILFFTALMSLILGMGLPTTANYIVVSSIMVPVIQTLTVQHGLVVPLIALHLFVFYFGILADDTPPVGLAAYAASAIAKSEPIATGVQGFLYDIRTAILPFIFIFNTDLLLIDIESWQHLLLTVGATVGAMMLFAAATQGFWIARSYKWESLLLLLLAFSLFRPGFWWDMIYPPLRELPPTELVVSAAALEDQGELRVRASGETVDGDHVERSLLLPLRTDMAGGEERLADAGVILAQDAKGRVMVESLEWGSPAQEAGLDLEWEIKALIVETERPAKQWFYLPVMLLLSAVALLQRRRLAPL